MHDPVGGPCMSDGLRDYRDEEHQSAEPEPGEAQPNRLPGRPSPQPGHARVHRVRRTVEVRRYHKSPADQQEPGRCPLDTGVKVEQTDNGSARKDPREKNKALSFHETVIGRPKIRLRDGGSGGGLRPPGASPAAVMEENSGQS
jgi:hypothetical protein